MSYPLTCVDFGSTYQNINILFCTISNLTYILQDRNQTIA